MKYHQPISMKEFTGENAIITKDFVSSTSNKTGKPKRLSVRVFLESNSLLYIVSMGGIQDKVINNFDCALEYFNLI